MSSTSLPSPISYQNLQDNCVIPQLLSLNRDPDSNDRYNIGTYALNTVAGSSWQLNAYSSGSPQWVALGGGSAAGILTINSISPTVGGNFTLAAGTGITLTPGTNTITIGLTGAGVAIDSFVPDAGTNPVVPTSAGAVTMAGTANQITTTGGTNTLTFSVPSTFIAPGSIASTTSLTAGNGFTVTTGTTSITGTVGINTTGAGVTTIGTGGTGAVNIGNATGNTAVTGSLTATTTLTATLGNITATNGNVSLGTAGNKLVIATGANASVGTSSAMSGTPGAVTVATTACSATALVFYSRATTGGTPGEVSITAQDGTGFTLTSTGNETSTFNWWIINA